MVFLAEVSHFAECRLAMMTVRCV